MQLKKEKEKKKKFITPVIKKILVLSISLFGTFLALFVGGYVMFLAPVYHLFRDWKSNTLTTLGIFRCIISVLLSSTAGGGIWCFFDIIAGLFREREDD